MSKETKDSLYFFLSFYVYSFGSTDNNNKEYFQSRHYIRLSCGDGRRDGARSCSGNRPGQAARSLRSPRELVQVECMSRLGQERVQGECTHSLVLVVQVVRGECIAQRELVLVVLAEGSHSQAPTVQKHRPRRRPQRQRQRLGISIEIEDWVS